jgi:hypothetical protein
MTPLVWTNGESIDTTKLSLYLSLSQLDKYKSTESCVAISSSTPNSWITKSCNVILPFACKKVSCAEGYFINSFGACEKCSSGTYQSTVNQYTCLVCPAGE